jgi:hypothetical protein
MGGADSDTEVPMCVRLSKGEPTVVGAMLLLTGEDHLVESSGLDLEPREGEIGISCCDRDIVSSEQ